MTIDEIRIEGEEDGFHLVIYTDDSEPARFRIGLPDQFYAEVQRTIGRWLGEGEAARVTAPLRFTHISELDAYEATNPKHPDYHDTMSGIYDEREGK